MMMKEGEEFCGLMVERDICKGNQTGQNKIQPGVRHNKRYNEYNHEKKVITYY